MNPDDPNAFAGMDTEDRKEAFHEVYKKIEEAPGDPALRVEAGALAKSLGKRNEAIASFVYALKLDRNRKDVLAALHRMCSPDTLRLYRVTGTTKPLWKDLLGAIGYPLRSGGLSLVIVGAVFFDLATLFCAMFSLWALPVLCVFWGYLASWYLRIVRGSSVGWTVVPDWPDVSHPMDALADLHMFTISATAAYLPAALVLALALVDVPLSMVVPVAAVLAFAGAFLFPMMLLVVSAYANPYAAFNVPFVLRSIWKIRGTYVFAWIALLLVGVGIGLLELAAHAVGFAATDWLVVHDKPASMEATLVVAWTVLTTALTIYGLVFFCHVLGRVYERTQDELCWFEGLDAAPGA